MESYKKLLLANRAWARDKKEQRPGFFEDLSKGQQPEFLWIGCSDSRVPAEEITGVAPGEVFVHRNVANLFIHGDFNLLGVLQYAVEFLKVKHVIVCGHYGCGGVRGALSSQCFGLLDQWLYYLKDTYSKHREELDALDEQKRLDRMVEINVQTQVQNLARTSIIQRAWQFENRPTLHGWVFDLRDGLLREVALADPSTKVEPIQHFDFPERRK